MRKKVSEVERKCFFTRSDVQKNMVLVSGIHIHEDVSYMNSEMTKREHKIRLFNTDTYIF